MTFELKKVFDFLDGRTIPGLRSGLLVVSVLQALLPLGLIFYIARHANPKGDGMEWVAMIPALFIAGFFAMPALILGAIKRLLIVGALLAIAGALVSFGFYTEIAREFSGAG
jgi:hypothetical protein